MDGLTEDRCEQKYLLPRGALAPLVQLLAQRLPPHRFQGPGANPLPRAQHFTTTVYFDTPTRALLAASGLSEHTKLRAREYYDLHPELLEMATDASELVRYTDVLWLELKHRTRSRSGKRRVGIPKREVPRFFRQGQVSERMRWLAEEVHGRDADAVVEELLAFARSFDEPLCASCLVNYRRSAWQSEDDRVRVTIDRGVSFFAPNADLWQGTQPLVKERLGEPAGQLEGAIVELKTLGDPPDWLGQAVGAAGVEPGWHSKFAMGSKAVHGPL